MLRSRVGCVVLTGDSGLMNAERNPTDARWIYYSINTQTMSQLKLIFADFFNVNRIQSRENNCESHIEDK